MPGAAIGSLLVLPLLQERLDKEAMEFATHRASLAEEEILRMEVGSYADIFFVLSTLETYLH